MTAEKEVRESLLTHLQSIVDNDIDSYHKTTNRDLTLYEWWITPHRIDGLPFHDFLMTEQARLKGLPVPVVERGSGSRIINGVRFDLTNLRIQVFGDTAIASYTFLLSSAYETGVEVSAHNESRVLVKINGDWQVVHAHKSPAWQAPHDCPK